MKRASFIYISLLAAAVFSRGPGTGGFMKIAILRRLLTTWIHSDRHTRVDIRHYPMLELFRIYYISYKTCVECMARGVYCKSLCFGN